MLMWLFVFGMILNVGLVPWFLTINKYNLINTIWALVLPTALPIWNVDHLDELFPWYPEGVG